MTDSEVLQLFKSMIDLNPIVDGYICFWCEETRPPEGNYAADRYLHTDCQWIRAMDLFGLPHPDHLTKETS